MSIIHWLDEISSTEYPAVGQIAYTLSQIKQQGYPVVAGLVISSSLFEEFLTLSEDLSKLVTDLAKVNFDDPYALQSFAQQSRQEILNTDFPCDWLATILCGVNQLSDPALRLIPSLSLDNVVDWHELLTGQFSPNHGEELSLAIKKIWAQLFKAKTLWFLQKRQISLAQIRFAVLIESYHTATASGIARINSSSVTIEATWGDELALNLGEVLPDRYQINRDNRLLPAQELGNKLIAYRLNNNLKELERYLLQEEAQQNYTLNQYQLVELNKLSFNLVTDYPNIESFFWSFRDNQLYLTQAKPFLIPMKSDSKLIVQGLGASSGKAIAPAEVITDFHSNWQLIPPQKILVFPSLTLDWLPLLKKAAGIITETGGLTSHVAIVARELGIPAIVGATQATELIKQGTLIQINGDTGEVCLPSHIDSQPELISDMSLPNYPISTQLFVNVSQLETLSLASHLPVDGVGLLRSEFFFLELLQQHSLMTWLSQHETELSQNLKQIITSVCQSFTPKPIFYRSLNWYALELSDYLQEFKTNPEIKEKLFNLELKILEKLIKEKQYNLNLILPFIRSVPEFKHYYQQVEKTGLLEQTSLQIWIMAEIPSVLFLLPEYVAAGVQGICIGTNDLSQFILGISREETFIPPELNTKHPAIKQAIKQLIQLAQTANIPCSICGQIPVEYPEIIPDLVRWGIQAISVEATAVIKTYWAIARAEQSIILDMARKIK